MRQKAWNSRQYFCPGLEDGLLPLRPEMIFAGKYETRPADLAEERRLFVCRADKGRPNLFIAATAQAEKLSAKGFYVASLAVSGQYARSHAAVAAHAAYRGQA